MADGLSFQLSVPAFFLCGFFPGEILIRVLTYEERISSVITKAAKENWDGQKRGRWKEGILAENDDDKKGKKANEIKRKDK